MTAYDEESTPNLKIPDQWNVALEAMRSSQPFQQKLQEKVLLGHLQSRLAGVLENTPENVALIEAISEYVAGVFVTHKLGSGLQKGMLYYITRNGRKLDRPYEWTGHHFVDHETKHRLLGDIAVQIDNSGCLAVCTDSKLY